MTTSMATNGKNQKSHVAIVTGAAQGIGKAIALHLAEDGFSICVNDLESNQTAIEKVVESIRALGREAYGHAADVSKLVEVEGLVSSCIEKLGPLDVMVANAGITEVQPLLIMKEYHMRRMIDINLFGVFNCFQTAAKHFVDQKTHGKLIAAASIASIKTFPQLTHYSASKFAVRGLVQGFAQELAPYGITANGYCPGITQTTMLDTIDDAMVKLHGTKPGESIKMYENMIALGRLSQPEDVAKLVSFLASPNSDYITGQNLVVDGGIVLT